MTMNWPFIALCLAIGFFVAIYTRWVGLPPWSAAYWVLLAAIALIVVLYEATL